MQGLRYPALAAAMPVLAGAQSLPVVTLNAGIHLIRAEVASTFESRMTGLMRREKLDANSGMLFVFPDVAPQCMWMKNTYIPLSVAFLDERGVIVSIADMKPQTEDSHCAARPARYALDMNHAWFPAKAVRPGAKICGLEQAAPPR